MKRKLLNFCIACGVSLVLVAILCVICGISAAIGIFFIMLGRWGLVLFIGLFMLLVRWVYLRGMDWGDDDIEREEDKGDE